MLKFLRKYQKIMLAIFICVLMVAFVAPQAMQQLKANPLKTKAASVDGRPVTMGDLQRANAEVRVLDSINPLILGMMMGVDQSHKGEHWYLLRHEAERAGMVGDSLDGRAFLDDVAFQTARLALQQQFGQFADQALQMPEYQQRIVQMAEEMAGAVGRAGGAVGMSELECLRTLAAARGVTRMRDAYFAAARPSPALAIRTARTYGDAATIDYLLLKGSSLSHEVPAPTPEELAAHFERFKNLEPGSGDFGIGYRRPDRVKLEWLALERAQIAGAITPDRVELRRMYDAQRTTYTGEYEAERERVKADYLAAHADEIMEEIARIIRAEVLRSARRLQQDGSYKRLPDSWATDRPSLQTIAQTVVETVAQSKGIRIPLPKVEIRDAAWMDQAAVAALPGIGNAAVRAGNNEMPFSAYVFQVRELGGNAALGLQAGLTEINAPARDFTGNRYYFTVLEARTASAPDAADEVETLEQDWRSIKGYERLLGELPMYEQLARTDSLEAVGRLIAGDGGTPAAPAANVEVGREVIRATDIELNTPAFRNAVMDAAVKLDPRKSPDEIAQDAAATFSHALPASRSVVLAHIKNVMPITIEQYRGLAIGVAYRAPSLELQEIVGGGELTVADANPFTYAAIRKRLKFEEVTPKGQKKEADEPTEPAQETPAGAEPRPPAPADTAPAEPAKQGA